jgi:hypothetical protein
VPLASAPHVRDEPNTHHGVQNGLQQLLNIQTAIAQQQSQQQNPQLQTTSLSGLLSASQSPLQVPLLQLLAAHQQQQQQQQRQQQLHTSNPPDSSSPAVAEAGQSKVVSQSEGPTSFNPILLQLLSLNQGNICAISSTPTDNNSKLQEALTTTSLGQGPTVSTGAFMQNHVPSRDAARKQQYQLKAALRAASASSSDTAIDGALPSKSGMMSNEELSYAFPEDVFDNRTPDGRAIDLPTLLVMDDDHTQLSAYQTLLRYQIEIFRASEVDASTHQRGRNKPIRLGQVGFRCRHCKHLSQSARPRGSSYFPSEVDGVYQAAQNMNTTHFQNGVCTQMGEPLRLHFAELANSKATSTGAGRAYWAQQARKLGLENNAEEGGIRFWSDKK